jgi:hypothetical protein
MECAMVDSTRDLLIAGLKDAYAMERQSEDMLAIQSRRCGDYPQLKARLDQHADETKQQQRRLEECLNSFDESPSMIKDAAMRTVLLFSFMSFIVLFAYLVRIRTRLHKTEETIESLRRETPSSYGT